MRAWCALACCAAACGGEAGARRVYREHAVAHVSRADLSVLEREGRALERSALPVPREPGLVAHVAAAPGGPRACVLLALGEGGAVLARDEASGRQGLPELALPEGTRRVWIASLGEPGAAPRSARVHVYVNDPRADGDGDGLGRALEHALGTCDAKDDRACAGSPLGAYYARVPRATRDTDRDGLPDDEELLGVRGEPLLDLPRYGADPRHKDVLVEVDRSKRVEPPGMLESDLAAIRDLYARGSAAALRNPDGRPGIAIHADVGFEPVDPALLGTFGDWGGSGVGSGDYKAARREHFSRARERYFRYAVLARGGLGQASGDAFVINRDFNRVALFAHELAHTLGLSHEGHRAWGAHNCKPNHRSIINYAYQNEPAVGFSRERGARLNPARVRERMRLTPSAAARLRAPPFELDATPRGVDWNRDGVISEQPVRAGLTWATYKSCMAGYAGRTVLAERARAATPVLVGGEPGRVHVLWLDPDGALVHVRARPAARCRGEVCAELSEAARIEGLEPLAHLAAARLDARTIALAHVNEAGDLGVTRLELRGDGAGGDGAGGDGGGAWRATGTQRLARAATQDAPAIVRAPLDPAWLGTDAAQPAWLVLYRGQGGALMQAVGAALDRPFQITAALDHAAAPIATATAPSALVLATGELCGVFPDAASHVRFYCYEPPANAWRDLSMRAFYATLGPKTGGQVGMAYHRFRYADGGFVHGAPASGEAGARGALYLSFTEPAPDTKAPDNPHLLVSRALDHGLLARDAIDFRWRGSLINQWAHTAGGSGVALYEDEALPGLVAALAARGDAGRARLELLPVADGTFDAELGTGDDFAVMERGICTRLRGHEACGGASTGAY